MDPKHFVGAVISLKSENTEARDWVLLKFLGAGNGGISYQIAPRSDPSTEKKVAKFPKSDVRFQMTVLHSSFRIAEEMFPEHPQRMSTEERLRRLTDEMLLRITSRGAAFGVKAYRNLLLTAELVLLRTFYKRFKASTLPDDFLGEIDAITPMLDENLVQEMELSLDENPTSQTRLFYEHCIEEVKKKIEVLKLANAFRPLLQNTLVKLLGLHLEGFIDSNELSIITHSKTVHEACTAQDFADFTLLMAFLYNRAISEKQNAASTSESIRNAGQYAYPIVVRAIIAAALYLDENAARYSLALSYLSGFAKSCLARTLLLLENESRAITLLEEALQFLITDESQPERYDTLMDLAKLLLSTDPDRAYAYAREALSIGSKLGYPQPE